LKEYEEKNKIEQEGPLVADAGAEEVKPPEVAK
jgi:hypothetical protein